MVIDQKDQTLFKYDYFIIEPNGGYERSAHLHRCTSYVAELHKKIGHIKIEFMYHN